MQLPTFISRSKIFALLFLSGIHGTGLAQKTAGKLPYETIPVAQVWSGHSVGFDLLTSQKFQYVAYYDADRNMVIAQRPLDSKTWKKTVLPTQVGWDSHNYIEVALDAAGYLHVSGNMHNVPLIYFRSEKPEDISRFEKLAMTGKNEEHVTYPIFFEDKAGDLYFQYRDGGSGNGITYWNKYDTANKTWRSLFDTPLFDGEKEASAYMSNPRLGPDGYFYIIWMWRMTPIANTNHNLACIRSRDLINWENMRGDKVPLPIQWRDSKPTADPVGPWNGLINMSYTLSWDQEKAPCISYHKYDSQGISQAFVARWEKDKAEKGTWQIHQISQWPDFTWALNLGGSLKRSISLGAVTPTDDGNLSLHFTHEKHGSGTWILDPKTLKPIRTLPANAGSKEPGPPALALNEGMEAHTKTDNTGRYVMRWQTLPVNQDRPPQISPPAPTELVVYEVIEK
ncbi:BNR repeat-containing protein [Salmonirosea aquatica]|uniref:Uncharacterized protein n=1 Tax=Salmonirosea aquatica TaxID=2654236 RepID=A0A7C9F923_9BACT|nr:hypothetical protein [Cytophagaceae bacterium SJW1-29]